MTRQIKDFFLSLFRLFRREVSLVFYKNCLFIGSFLKNFFILKILSLNLKSLWRDSILRLKKIFTAIQIIYYIIVYYIKKWGFIFWIHFKDSFLRIEIKSFFVVIFFSFFFYYFIVVELSILLFGYSLLCYWFLFLLVLASIIVSWRLEAEFLKDEMLYILGIDPIFWVKYYRGKNPLSLSDFLTNYRFKPLFRLLVIRRSINDLEEGWFMLFTFFFFLAFFFIYSCSYWFDPHFVWFVAQYFHPVVSFFESWRNPWWEDFLSAIIWFWNRLVYGLDYTSIAKNETYQKLKIMTIASPRIEDRAHLQWAYKTSLRKRVRFNDIFFLWTLFLYTPIRWLAFDLEQPVINATWFDPNWKLFFLWYVTDWFTTDNDNFWKNYFFNDQNFWWLIKGFKEQIDSDVDWVDLQIVKNFRENNKFSLTFFEVLLSENYFNGRAINAKPYFEKYGTNRDYYENLLLNGAIDRQKVDDYIKDIFTSSAYYAPPFTLSGLRSFNKNYWDNYLKKTNYKKELAYKLYNFSKNLNIFASALQSGDKISDFVDAVNYDFDLPLYNFNTMESFGLLKLETLWVLFIWPIWSENMATLYNKYNQRISSLERLFGFQDDLFFYKKDEYVSPQKLILHVNWRIKKLLNSLKNDNNEFVTDSLVPSFFDDVKYLYYNYLNPYNFYLFLERRFYSNTLGYSKEDLDKRYMNLNKPKYVVFTDWEIDEIILMETWLWEIERMAGVWDINLLKLTNKDLTTLNKVEKQPFYPWYMWTLQYFSTWNYRFVMPGFVWYYYPTPFPTPFSTFGVVWNKYQFYWKNTASTIVGYSDSVAELWNSTPLALYAGVEAILYVKPLFELFDYFIWLVINFINYPIEIIITQEFIWPLSSLSSLIFFAHFVWFIHFYIYIFIFFYLLYYFFWYYFHKIGFVWFYERMFEETLLSSYSNKWFWHTLNDFWLNYWTPEQYLLFSLHTNLMLHYTFFNYTNFYFYKKNRLAPILKLLIKLLAYENDFKEYSKFSIYFNFTPDIMVERNNFFIFWSFFNITSVKFKPLLFTGGVECSVDHLIWSYYEYLNQTSMYLSWSLQKNFYKLNEFTELNSLMKIFTVLLGSTCLLNNFYLLVQPLLDTLLAWKVLLNLIFLLERKFFLNKINLQTDFLFSLRTESFPIIYTLFQSNNYEFYNYYITSGLDIYEYFNNKLSLYLTRTNSLTFWDDKWYWFLAFFWSFRFVPRYRFIAGNLNLSYETSRLHLARIAYSNSWIAQSTYVRPFFNIVQHIWWTSWVFNTASTLLQSTCNLYQPMIGSLDVVWNFTEKWYPWALSHKVETIFGLVRTINLQPYYEIENYGLVPYENKNFDLTFPDQLIDKKTTNREYLKTNPPINVQELGITPLYLIKLFLKLPWCYFKFYLTFYRQLYFILSESMLVDRDLSKEYKRLSIFEGVFWESEHEFYTKYDFYVKEFDFLLNIATEWISRNWFFSFDCSFFLSHFMSWDFFGWDLSNLWPNILKPYAGFDQEVYSYFISNLDMIANLQTTDNWFLKPFGILDKLELFSMKKYKMIKILDEKSFSRNRDDVFSMLDREHTVSEIGLSVYSKEDPKNLLQAYNEEYTGFWEWKFPYNSTLVWNAVAPVLVGWVGTLVTNATDSLNLMYSLLYASPKPGIEAWKTPNELVKHKTKINGIVFEYESFFGKSVFQQQLFSRAFTWLNLILHPSSYRYSFGPKALARNDYWSWKVGMVLDYKNGLYSYRPYLGFWHAFGTRLTSYDNLYGFYWTYWYVDDDPLNIDHSTEAVDHLKNKDEEEIIEDLKASVKPDSEKVSKLPDYDPWILDEFTVPYWEVYYSFQHPYFIGHLLFWMFLYSNYFNYLGIINYSLWRFVAYEFILNNSYLNFEFWDLVLNRKIIENRFRKQMVKYRIYYMNPVALLNALDCVLDNELNQPLEMINTLQSFYFKNCYLVSFLSKAMSFTLADMFFVLDFWKIYNNIFLINWLSLDLPFSVNPYLVISHHWFFKDTSFVLNFYKAYFFSFSWHDTVNENFNFNLFFDWSNGCFLDTINLVSYFGAYWGSVGLNELFFDNPSFIAAYFVKYKTDKSSDVARSLRLTMYYFNYSDLLISGDLALNNLCLMNFFQETFEFLIDFEGKFIERWNVFGFLKFYFETQYFENWVKTKTSQTLSLTTEDSIKPILTGNFLKFKKLFFVFRLQKTLSYDSLVLLVSSGLLFTNRIWLGLFFKSLRFWLHTRYSSTYSFYKRVGHLVSLFFFKKK